MERGVGKMEVNVRDEFGVAHTVHVDPDATIESVHEQLRELTGVSRDTQATCWPLHSHRGRAALWRWVWETVTLTLCLLLAVASCSC